MTARDWVNWDELTRKARRDFRTYARTCECPEDRALAAELATEANARLPHPHRACNEPTHSEYYGVRYAPHLPDCPWRARIQVHGKTVWLGYYATAEQAARAHDNAARKYRCRNAPLNFP